jgi:hypothetical protein
MRLAFNPHRVRSEPALFIPHVATHENVAQWPRSLKLQRKQAGTLRK